MVTPGIGFGKAGEGYVRMSLTLTVRTHSSSRRAVSENIVMSTVYLALGSNLGDRLQYIQKAVEELEACGLKMIKLSTVIETDPVGGVPQGKYLNAVLKASTALFARRTARDHEEH